MKSKKREFSKLLLIQETILIWLVTLIGLFLACYSIINQCYNELPWIATLIMGPWTAYGVSQAFYYKKAEKENSKDGIKFETVMAQLRQIEYEELNPSENEEVFG